MRLTFVYNMEDEYWDDGLKKALDLLPHNWQIRRQNGRYVPVMTDFVLVWGSLNSEQADVVAKWPFRKGICIAGGPISHPNVHEFDVVFVETRWHQREFKKIGIDAKIAFGTNTELFRPIKQSKSWSAIYPAAFARWKRHEIFADKYGDKGLAVGYMQPNDHEKECIDVCVNNDVMVMPRVKPEVMPYLYNASEKVHVTSDVWGGGERTVLEGLACGLEVEVEPDNEKLVMLLEDSKRKLLTHSDYAKSLREGIEECLN